MPQVISAVQSKGGVAKSTTIISLAARLAKDGAKPLIIDTDPQQTCVKWVEKADCGVDAAEHLDHETLLDVIASVSKTYDTIFIDTAGYTSAMAVYTIGASDLVLVPTRASEPDAEGAVKTIRHILNTTANNRRQPKVRALFTDVDRNTNITSVVLESLKSAGVEVIEAPMWHRTGFKEMHSTGGLPSGGALTALNQIIAAMQIDGLLDFYEPKKTKKGKAA